MQLIEILKESPSSGISAKKKSKIEKEAHKGKDVFNGGFKKVEKAAEKEYGSKAAGERVAAAVMWKKIRAEK